MVITRKFMISEIEMGEKKANSCFTEDSYLVVKIPSAKEKMLFASKFKEHREDQVKTLEMISDFIHSVMAKSLDDEVNVIDNFETITCFADATIIIDWLAALIGNGFVPKKASTV